MNKRYQVFVSSTYADLKDERSRVMQTLMEMDCIPSGMELFPAADEEQFEFIKKVIDDCDYYLLIIGGRYGSTTDAGISYTEKEYDYAIERGLKVIAFLHHDPRSIPLEKTDKSPTLAQQLEAFREKVQANRLVKQWRSAAELPGLVSVSLSRAIKTYPAVGWIRGDSSAPSGIPGEAGSPHIEQSPLEVPPSIPSMSIQETPAKAYLEFRRLENLYMPRETMPALFDEAQVETDGAGTRLGWEVVEIDHARFLELPVILERFSTATAAIQGKRKLEHHFLSIVTCRGTTCENETLARKTQILCDETKGRYGIRVLIGYIAGARYVDLILTGA